MQPATSRLKAFETAKLKLITIVGAASHETAILSLLASTGASGYTTTPAAGFGRHGVSRPGLVESGNVRVEVLLAAGPARTLLEKLLLRFAGQQVIAFMVDAEAIPVDHFTGEVRS